MIIKHCLPGSILFFFLLLQCTAPEKQGEADTPPPESESKITPAMAEDKPAIQRVVAFKFKAGTSAEAVQQHMDDFAALQDSIPTMLSYRAGRTFPAEYEGTGDFDVLHYATYESEAAVEEYFKHPAHQRFIERNQAHWERVMVLNSEVQ